MYPPAVGFVKQSPKGGITLSGHHIPESTLVTVSTIMILGHVYKVLQIILVSCHDYG